MAPSPSDRPVAPPRQAAPSRAEPPAPFDAPTVALLIGLVVSVLMQWIAVAADSDALSRIALVLTYIAFLLAVPGNRLIGTTIAARDPTQPQSPSVSRRLGAGCIVVGCGIAEAVLVSHADGYSLIFRILTAYLIAAGLLAIAFAFLADLAFMPTWPSLVINAVGIGIAAAEIPGDSFSPGLLLFFAGILALRTRGVSAR